LGAVSAPANEEIRSSANGQTLAFPTPTGLATVPIGGGSVTAVNGSTAAADVDPSFTPDGSKLVFQNAGLFTISATGGDAKTSIFGSPTTADEPEVSPNGATVAFIDTAAADCGGTANCLKT